MPAAATTRTQTPRPAAPTPQAAPAAAPRAAAPSPATRPLSGPPAIRLASPAGGAPDANLPEAVKAVINNPGSGELLLSPVRMSLENSLEVPLTPVRVHTDQRAGAAVDALGARAFTYGTHVFLGSRERPTDLALMAHEVTHVVQQHGKAVIQTSGGVAVSDRFEQEAQRTATAVQHGDQVSVRERTSGPRVQGVWPIDEAAQWVEDQAWSLLSQYAPELVPILRQGPVEWLKEKISAAVEAVFTTLMGPVRAITGIAGALIGHFANLLAWLRDAAARIARGDCGPLTEAAEKIQQVFEGLTAPVIDRIKQLVDRVKGFFSGLWERFGAPVWQFLQRIGGAAWERIQQLGRWIWDKTAPIRRALDRAWTWIKNKLGIGEGAEGQDGILQWLQRKAQAVWDQYLRPFYERFRTPILVTIGILALLSPAGPLIAIAATWGTLAVGIRWIRQNLRNRTAIVQQRGLLEGRIIPGIMNAITRVSAFVLDKAQFISSKLTAVVTGLSQAVGAVAGTILGFAVGILQWIIARYQELVRWATGQLLALAAWVSGALERLRIFLMPVLNFLRRVAAVAANVMRLPYELGGRIWNAIPACLRDPFIDFFIPLILRQIPFFRNLAETPEVWQRTRAQVMGLFQQVFRDFDLLGAMRSAFRLIVQTLRIPVDLIAQLLDKAARAWDLVIAAPLRFIENALKAILFGLGNFMRNILSHLWFGVQGWLFNSLQGTGVTLPSSWTDLRAVFGFVLDVMGISIDHVIDLIDRRVPGAGAVLRRGVNFLTGAWEWLKVALTEGPRGIWRMVVDRLTGLGQIVLEAAVRWVMTRIVAIVGARLSALAASAGWSLVIEAVVFIYQAIRTAMEYAQRIFQIFLTAFNTVVQIAQGVVGPAATMIENGLRSILPIVIGFLANYAGLGGISNRIRDIIGGIRERVDAAILWLIDRGISTVQSLLNLIRRGVATVTGRWKEGMGAVATVVQRAKNDSLDQRAIDAALQPIKGEYGFKELRVVTDGKALKIHAVMNPEEWVPIEVGGETFMVFVGDRTAVKVQLGETEVDLPVAEKNKALVQGLKITREEAAELLREINAIAPSAIPQRLPQLLLSFARRTGDPQKFLERLLADPAGGMGMDAVAGPVPKDIRDSLVNLGVDEHGEQRQSLSHLAIVFRESYTGQFQQKTSGSVAFTEWQYRDPRTGERANTNVFHLGIVHVGDGGDYDGVIIDVIKHNPKLPGGRAQLIQLMRDAGWHLKEGLS